MYIYIYIHTHMRVRQAELKTTHHVRKLTPSIMRHNSKKCSLVKSQITRSTIWLFNITMERSTMFQLGKPSISMGHFPSIPWLMLVITSWYVSWSAHHNSPGLRSSSRPLSVMKLSARPSSHKGSGPDSGRA